MAPTAFIRYKTTSPGTLYSALDDLQEVIWYSAHGALKDFRFPALKTQSPVYLFIYLSHSFETFSFSSLWTNILFSVSVTYEYHFESSITVHATTFQSKYILNKLTNVLGFTNVFSLSQCCIIIFYNINSKNYTVKSVFKISFWL